MTRKILNPVRWEDIESGMTEAEEQFAECLARGNSCVLGDAVPTAEKSGPHNTVRPEVIRFFAYGGDSGRPARGPSVGLQGAWISGDLDLTYANIPYALLFGDCHFADSVRMQHAKCVALNLGGSHLAKGLNADGLTTTGSVDLRAVFFADGEVRLLGASIGGNLTCVRGKFHNPNGDALSADGLTTKGSVHLRDGFSAEGEVRLLGASIGGNLTCVSGRFRNPNGDALSADGLTTKGSVLLRDGFSAEGGVRLVNASIGGNLDCVRGKFHNPKGDALSADGLTAKGSVHLRDGFSAEGEVRLLGASIGGDLTCVSGKFHNPKGDAFSADRLTTKGDVHLRAGFSADGGVRLLGASIGGHLDCVRGKFHNPNRHALTADGLTTKGDVRLRAGFSADGEVRLSGANIGGNLACESGKFHNPKGCALNVQNGNINGALLWREISGGGVVYLGHAKAGVLADELDSWESFKVILDGFTYDQISGPTDAESRIDWLGNRPANMSFSPLPYEQAAKVLFGMGHARDAREILLEKERLQTADKRTPLLRKIGRSLWDVFAGYGYRLRRTAYWMAGFVFLGAFVFWFADESGCIAPNRPVVLVNAKYNDAMNSVGRQDKCPAEADRPTRVATDLFPDYPEFNAFVYSLDVFIPVFALHQEPNWHPRPCLNRDLTLRFLAWWHWLEIGAGWILTSLFLLSVTGVLRPRQSSGEKD